MASSNAFSFEFQSRKKFLVLPRHRHHKSHLVLVLSGGYEEVGDFGRFRLEPGQMLSYDSFEAHLTRYSPIGAQVLNFSSQELIFHGQCFMYMPDPDAVALLAEKDIFETIDYLITSAKPISLKIHDWPDELAIRIRCNPLIKIGDWAESRGLAKATVSRGFKKAFGIGPCSYRAEVRGYLAWKEIKKGGKPLSTIAADLGFSDQSHMTRTVRAITGQTPSAWRRQNQIDSIREDS